MRRPPPNGKTGATNRLGYAAPIGRSVYAVHIRAEGRGGENLYRGNRRFQALLPGLFLVCCGSVNGVRVVYSRKKKGQSKIFVFFNVPGFGHGSGVERANGEHSGDR